MKQNIIMIILLVALFIFGLLIYDFSDELDPSITDHDWYSIEDEMTVISFKDRKFSYFYAANEKPVSLYELCINYRFNKSINVIKLNCNLRQNKLYITKTTDEELILTIDGEEKTFYASEVLAKEAKFMESNKLSKSEFNDLMNIDLNKYTITTFADINTLYKSKETKLIAFVSDTKTIKNALNLRALYNLTNNSSKPVLVIDYNTLKDVELVKLAKLNKEIPTNINDFNQNNIPIYIIGNKSFKLATDIDVSAFSEVNNYNNI